MPLYSIHSILHDLHMKFVILCGLIRTLPHNPRDPRSIVALAFILLFFKAC